MLFLARSVLTMLIAQLCPLGAVTLAQADGLESPVGLWLTFDDVTGKEDSRIRISENEGVVSGRIERLLNPEDSPDIRCDKCMDDRKNQPLMGMTILKGLKKTKAMEWDGGTILDPDTGVVYHARLRLLEGGKKIELTGYGTLPFMEQNDIWIRIKAP